MAWRRGFSLHWPHWSIWNVISHHSGNTPPVRRIYYISTRDGRGMGSQGYRGSTVLPHRTPQGGSGMYVSSNRLRQRAGTDNLHTELASHSVDHTSMCSATDWPVASGNNACSRVSRWRLSYCSITAGGAVGDGDGIATCTSLEYSAAGALVVFVSERSWLTQQPAMHEMGLLHQRKRFCNQSQVVCREQKGFGPLLGGHNHGCGYTIQHNRRGGGGAEVAGRSSQLTSSCRERKSVPNGRTPSRQPGNQERALQFVAPVSPTIPNPYNSAAGFAWPIPP